MDKTILPNEQMEAINHRLAKRSIAYLETHYSSEMAEFSSIQRIMEQLHRVITATESGKKQDEKDQLDSIRDLNKRAMLELLEQRRVMLHSIHDENAYDEEVIWI